MQGSTGRRENLRCDFDERDSNNIVGNVVLRFSTCGFFHGGAKTGAENGSCMIVRTDGHLVAEPRPVNKIGQTTSSA
ncbi:MAG: hypothetical protein ACI8P0_000441 [Planctomycetaceae bacterium]|jgi:hypothetical protein